MKLTFSNSHVRRTKGISEAKRYWGFLGVFLVSNNVSITFVCTTIQFIEESTYEENLNPQGFDWAGKGNWNKHEGFVQELTSTDSTPCPIMNSTATMQRIWCHRKALPLIVNVQSWAPSWLHKKNKHAMSGFRTKRQNYKVNNQKDWCDFNNGCHCTLEDAKYLLFFVPVISRTWLCVPLNPIPIVITLYKGHNPIPILMVCPL